MACLEAVCTKDSNHELQFSNSSEKIAICKDCGSPTRIYHDEFGLLRNNLIKGEK